MPDIYHQLIISAPQKEVYSAVSTPEGLSAWWSNAAMGEVVVDEIYHLDFGPEYQWKGVVRRCDPFIAFDLEMTKADDDWTGTLVSFRLRKAENGMLVEFSHTGWPQNNDHYRTSCYCWAMYLRCLKLYLEEDITLPYERRFEGK